MTVRTAARTLSDQSNHHILQASLSLSAYYHSYLINKPLHYHDSDRSAIYQLWSVCHNQSPFIAFVLSSPPLSTDIWKQLCEIKQWMSLASCAHNGKFPSSHSSLMCNVIAKWLASAPEQNGKINWHDVSALFQSRVCELDKQNSTIYSDIDCHRHWRYLAYGEIQSDNDSNLNASHKHEDSEEVQYNSCCAAPLALRFLVLVSVVVVTSPVAIRSILFDIGNQKPHLSSMPSLQSHRKMRFCIHYKRSRERPTEKHLQS